MQMDFLQPTSKQIKSLADYNVKKLKISMKDVPTMDKIDFQKLGKEWLINKLLIRMQVLRNGPRNPPNWVRKKNMQRLHPKKD